MTPSVRPPVSRPLSKQASKQKKKKKKKKRVAEGQKESEQRATMGRAPTLPFGGPLLCVCFPVSHRKLSYDPQLITGKRTEQMFTLFFPVYVRVCVCVCVCAFSPLFDSSQLVAIPRQPFGCPAISTVSSGITT